MIFSGHGSNKSDVVELRGRLSNTGTRTKIDQLHEMISGFDAEVNKASSPPPPGLRRRWWAMRDRLDEETCRQLIEDRQAGMTQKALAYKYAISLSSVQRLLRRLAEPEVRQTF
jgi:hypothetical protein